MKATEYAIYEFDDQKGLETLDVLSDIVTETDACMFDLERRARIIAARKCGLVKDPKGERLPTEIWQQALEQAIAERRVATDRLRRALNRARMLLGHTMKPEQMTERSHVNNLLFHARYWASKHDVASNRQEEIREVLKACADRIEYLEGEVAALQNALQNATFESDR